MIAFEPDGKVLLTEINLWLYVWKPANTSGCTELSYAGLSNALYYFFLKLPSETCLHSAVVAEYFF